VLHCEGVEVQHLVIELASGTGDPSLIEKEVEELFRTLSKIEGAKTT